MSVARRSAAAVLLSVALALSGLVLVAPSASAATTPAFYSCAQHPYRRMGHFNLACGDGQGYFDYAHWHSWTGTRATGTARQWFNTCKPDCAAGNYIKRRVSVTFYRPRTLDFHRWFSRILVGGAHGYRSATPRPPRGCASTAEYNSIHRGFTRAHTERIFDTTGTGTSTHRAYKWCTQYPGSGFTIYAEVWYKKGRVTHKMWSDD